jgi:hypothetical protein
MLKLDIDYKNCITFFLRQNFDFAAVVIINRYKMLSL